MSLFRCRHRYPLVCRHPTTTAPIRLYHYPRVPLSSPAQPKLACSLTPSSNTRNCSPISLPHCTTILKASTHHRTFHKSPLPQWHLLLSLQQPQAVALALHAQIRAASGRCIPSCILYSATTQHMLATQLFDIVSDRYKYSITPTVAHHFARYHHGLLRVWSTAY